METRIKYIKKNRGWYYAVQVKKWIFWKTIYTDALFSNVEKFINILVQIDEINNKAKSSNKVVSKSLNKIVYNGWAVRNVYENSGPGFSISFFNSAVHKRNSGDTPVRTWVDCNDNTSPTMEINTKKLFGKECLEPMKLRITIEQMG